MRIAISGTHRSGKSTLIEELSKLMPTYRVVDEPYHLMVEDGHELSHPPSLEDFEAQLERSVEELSDGSDNVLFDRCPVDFLAYISVHADSDAFDLDEWLPRVRAAVQTLDLVVFVPIEARDRITLAASDDDDDTRESVDEKLRELLVEDSLDLDVEVLEVEGDLATRVRAALHRIR
jgi:thymidylate kinase